MNRFRSFSLTKFSSGFAFGLVIAIAFHSCPDFWIDFFREKLIEAVLEAILRLLA
jgi:hypothetical protein